jgi:hypothetical protein
MGCGSSAGLVVGRDEGHLPGELVHAQHRRQVGKLEPEYDLAMGRDYGH